MSESIDIQCAQSVYASVAHRYWNPSWTNEKNLQVYGQDASAEGLGSNLRLELTVPHEHEPHLSGALASIHALIDHQCLFQHELGEEGSSLVAGPSTVETIALALATKLKGPWCALTVWESEQLGCTVRPGSGAVEWRVCLYNLHMTGIDSVDHDSGLSFDRAALRSDVDQVFMRYNEIVEPDLAKWSQKLFHDLQQTIAKLVTLRIDLGSHEYLLIKGASRQPL